MQRSTTSPGRKLLVRCPSRLKRLFMKYLNGCIQTAIHRFNAA